MEQNLDKIRQKIDKIDDKIIELYKERMNISKEVLEYKIKNKKRIYDKKREIDKLNKIKDKFESDFEKENIENFYSQLMSISRNVQYELINKDEYVFDRKYSIKIHKSSLKEVISKLIYSNIVFDDMSLKNKDDFYIIEIMANKTRKSYDENFSKSLD